jgi:hypothetical protein
MATLGLTICVALSVCPPQQPSGEAASEQLSRKIPRADREKYKSISDAKDWSNPFLVIRADGIEVISKSLPSGRRVVPTKELRRTLVELPAGAWPYGRVVAVQEIGIRSDGDSKPIDQNKKAMRDVLKRLGIELEWWPGA